MASLNESVSSVATAAARTIGMLSPTRASDMRADPAFGRWELLAGLVPVSIVVGWMLSSTTVLVPSESRMLAIAVALGFLSRWAGFSVWVGYTLREILTRFDWSNYREGSPQEGVLLSGRFGWLVANVVAILLVYALVVGLPRAVRWIAEEIGAIELAPLRNAVTNSERRTLLIASALVMFVWWETAPLIIRGIFLLQGRGPDDALLMRRYNSMYLLAAAIIGVLMQVELRRPRMAAVPADVPILGPRAQGFLSSIVAAPLVTLLFVGLYRNVFHMALAYMFVLIAFLLLRDVIPIPRLEFLANFASYGILAAIAIPILAGMLFVPDTLDGNNINWIVFIGFGSAIVSAIALRLFSVAEEETTASPAPAMPAPHFPQTGPGAMAPPFQTPTPQPSTPRPSGPQPPAPPQRFPGYPGGPPNPAAPQQHPLPGRPAPPMPPPGGVAPNPGLPPGPPAPHAPAPHAPGHEA